MEISNMKDASKEAEKERSSKQNLDERVTIYETDSDIRSSIMDSEFFNQDQK